jgi:hypothetical protein
MVDRMPKLGAANSCRELLSISFCLRPAPVSCRLPLLSGFASPRHMSPNLIQFRPSQRPASVL